MSKTGSFLWNLFCSMVMFFYHKSSGAVEYTQKLCPSPNQYVVSCQNVKLGTNWLKGGTLSGKKVEGRRVPDLNIESYYGATELSDKEKSIALRYFFDTAGVRNQEIPNSHPTHPEGSEALEEVLSKIDAANEEHITEHTRYLNTTPSADLAAGDSTYTSIAGDLLTLLCSNKKNVVCATCPDGVVDDSLYVYDEFNIYADTWKIYTIADCYKYDFTDTTGTYNYYQNSASTEPYKFYYDITKVDATGSTLGSTSSILSDTTQVHNQSLQ